MRFNYTAINNHGKTIEGVVEANNRESALDLIRKLNYRPLVIKPEKKGFNFNLSEPKIKSDDLTIFTRQLSAMVSASVPLVRSLISLSGDGTKPLSKVIKQIVADIENGDSMADSMARHPQVFDNIYVNMVRAGEAAGILDDILKRLAIQQEKSNTIRKKIKSAMTYPTVLVGITVVAFFGLMLFVIPQIGNVLKNLAGDDAELPALTQILMSFSNFIINFWYIIFPSLIGGVFGLLKYIKTSSGKAIFDRLILKIPGVGPIITKIVVARFSRTFSALMGAGVSVITALEVTSNAVGNTVYYQSLNKAVAEVKNGRQLSSILKEESHLWPEIVVQMVGVGEETGNTEMVLTKVADFYEEEVDLAIEQINSVIEPVMIVIMGGMVGVIAAGVMEPIASLSKNVK